MINSKKVDDLGDIVRMDFICCAVIGFDKDGEPACLAYTSEKEALEEHALRKLLDDFMNTDGIDLLLPSTRRVCFDHTDEKDGEDY